MTVNAQETTTLCSAAAEEFNRHENRCDGLRVLESLAGGLTLSRDALYARIHADVERRVGMDSMIFPLSEEKSERTTKLEIEIYQIVVAAGTARCRDYVSDESWFRDWLIQFRMGRVETDSRAARRIGYYASKSGDEQRLAFSNVLTTTQPEAARAVDPAAIGGVRGADCHRAGLRQVGRRTAMAARAGRDAALNPRLPSLSRQAVGKRRAMPNVRQSALDLRVAHGCRRMTFPGSTTYM